MKNLSLCINDTGGLDILIKKFKETGIWHLVDKSLGKRNARAVFSYSDAIQQWTLSAITGAKRLQHSKEHSYKFKNNPDFKKSMGPDAISRITRKLACKNTYYNKVDTKNKITNTLVLNPAEDQKILLNEVNYNQKLNALLLDSAIKLGIFKSNVAYSLDIDATIVPTKVSDSRIHYKKTGTGYCPMVVMLNGVPIFTESRNGNSSSMFRIKNVLENAIDLIESRNIKIKFVRIDAAGCNKSVLTYLLKRKLKFFIRASAKLETKISKSTKKWKRSKDWKNTFVSDRKIKYNNFEIRQVDYKQKNKKEWGILTNNTSLSQINIVDTYNQRGLIEQRFSDLKFIGWHYMVHHELKYNTVHMIISMLAYILFLSAKRWIATKLKFITEKIEPATFIKKFMQVLTTWHQSKLMFISRKNDFIPFYKL